MFATPDFGAVGIKIRSPKVVIMLPSDEPLVRTLPAVPPRHCQCQVALADSTRQLNPMITYHPCPLAIRLPTPITIHLIEKSHT